KIGQLRQAGLSEAKAKSILDLTDRALARTLPSGSALQKMTDQQVIENLTQIRGIGVWSAEMFLIFSLGRPDVLSVGDLGLKKGFAKIKGLTQMPSPDQFIEGAQKWRPFRSVASW